MGDDVGVSVVLFVLMFGAGVLLVWMARAAASGRLKRNSTAGIRVPSTMASDEAWLAAHVRAKRPTMLAGFVSMGSALFALLPVPAPVLAAAVIVACAVMIGCLIYGARVGSAAASGVATTSGE